jgi:hypothetical protein
MTHFNTKYKPIQQQSKLKTPFFWGGGVVILTHAHVHEKEVMKKQALSDLREALIELREALEDCLHSRFAGVRMENLWFLSPDCNDENQLGHI